MIEKQFIRKYTMQDMNVIHNLIAGNFGNRESVYREVKKSYPEHLILFSNRHMFDVINDDAKKLNETFGYKIFRNKARFPRKGGLEKVSAKFSIIIIGSKFNVVSIKSLPMKKESNIKNGDVLFLNIYNTKDVEERYYLEDKGYVLSTKRAYIEKNNCKSCFAQNKKLCTLLKCPFDAINYFRNQLMLKYPELVSLEKCCIIVIPNSEGIQNGVLTLFARNTFYNAVVLHTMFYNLILENNNRNGASKVDRFKRKEAIIQYKIDQKYCDELLKYKNIIILDDVATTNCTLDAFEDLLRLNVNPSTKIYKLAFSKTL